MSYPHEIKEVVIQGDILQFKVTSASREGLVHEPEFNMDTLECHCSCESHEYGGKKRRQVGPDACRHVRFVLEYATRRNKE